MATHDCKHEDLVQDMKKALFGENGLVRSHERSNTKLNIICIGLGAILMLIIGQWFDSISRDNKERYHYSAEANDYDYGSGCYENTN